MTSLTYGESIVEHEKSLHINQFALAMTLQGSQQVSCLL